MSQMHNPPHPGLILRHDVLPELGLTVSDAAAQLGVARVTPSRVIDLWTARKGARSRPVGSKPIAARPT